MKSLATWMDGWRVRRSRPDRKARQGCDAIGTPAGAGSGFTLIELLVVIAIISLLVSILLPSLSMAKELTRRAVCASNLHGIALSANVYASDEDGRLPRGGDGKPQWGVLFLQSLHDKTAALFKDYDADPEPEPGPHQRGLWYAKNKNI